MKGFTSVPNPILDDVLATLSDTELRVMLIVCRQTLGFTTRSGKRKQADWLSGSQLELKTGRGKNAVSRAIDSLVKQGLIEVSDVRGRVLASSAARRRAFGRLYFTLGPKAQQDPSFPISRSPKGGTTKEKQTKEIYKWKEQAAATPVRVNSGWQNAGAVFKLPRTYQSETQDQEEVQR